MPKLKESPSAKADKAFRAQVAAFAEAESVRHDEIARRLRICCATYNTRRKNPGTMRLDELRRLAQICKWDARTVCEIVGVVYK